MYGPRVPIRSNWNIQLLQQIVMSVADREVVQFLQFGWPLNHDGRKVTVTLDNHASAKQYPDQMWHYICKEWRLGCLLGPFLRLPWQEQVAVSPMSTRPKREGNSRRVIMDLSWLRNGESVNDGISKTEYMNQPMELLYPTVDHICKRVHKLGTWCRGYRKDMLRAFKQIPMDPSAWLLLGIFWEGLIFFDKTAMMGSQSAPYVCQQMTNVIHHIMKNLNYFVFNYIDDFMDLKDLKVAWQSYWTLGRLLRDLGVSEAEDKSVPSSEIIKFLGVMYDFIRQTISVTPARLHEIMMELTEWQGKQEVTRKELDRLMGKLQFVANCVCPGRVFVQRLRQQMIQMGENRKYTFATEVKRDINWWRIYLPKYNQVSIMWMACEPEPDAIFATDSCLQGMGGLSRDKYFHAEIPQHLRESVEHSIVHYEMIALVIGMRLWGLA